MTVQIPIWLLSLIIPLFFSVLIAAISLIIKATKESTKVATVVEEIDKRLNRIEDKLDKHILKEN